MSVVNIAITGEGKPLATTARVLSVDVIREVNKIPFARLLLADGTGQPDPWLLSDDPVFTPGNEVIIKLRYEQDSTNPIQVFKGVVVNHAISAQGQRSFLTVELKHVAVKLTQARENMVFKDKSDVDIMKELLGASGLSVKGTQNAPFVHPDFVLVNSNKWDSSLLRAEATGHYVICNDTDIVVQTYASAPAGGKTHKFIYGTDIIFAFELSIEGGNQVAKTQQTNWDPAKQAMTAPAAAKEAKIGFKNQSPDAIGQIIGLAEETLATSVSMTPDEGKAWAMARNSKLRNAFIRGYLKVKGGVEILPGDKVTLEGFGDRFKGTALVTGVRHEVTTNGWQIDVQLGFDAEWYYNRPDVNEPPAAGLLPAINGLQIGVVDEFEADAKGKNFRVRVLVPAVNKTSKKGAIWARMATPHGGGTAKGGGGYFFWPYKGAEVVVGFINNDPRQAIVLGSMFSSKNKPPVEESLVTKDNFDKGIYAQEGMSISFNEKEKSIDVLTSEGQYIKMNEEKKLVEVKDANGNTITMDENGIKITSIKHFTIDASSGSGNVTITGSAIDIN